MIPRLPIPFLLLSLVIQPISTQFTSQFDASECQISKGCHIPEPSQSNGMGVAWHLLDDETLDLELFVNADQENGRWVAVGFSDDELMGNEPVIECSAIGNQAPSMKFSFDKATGKGNQRIEGDYSAHFSDSTAQFQNGVLYCRSKVKISGSSNSPNVFEFDPSKDYFLLLANGKTTAKGLGYHKEQSSVSRKVRLAENSPGFDQSECGKSKGCTMPTADSCYNVQGDIGASYRIVSQNEIEFEIFGPANTTVNQNVYVGLGFSNDEKMNDISVIECSQLPSDTAPVMKFSYNSGFNNTRIQGEEAIRKQLIQQSIGRISDGQIYCKGVVNVGGDANTPEVFRWNQSQGYHLMFAAGFSGPNGLTQHWGSCVSILTFLDQVNNIGFNDATCGITKGCFSPTDCQDGDCGGIRSSWAVLSPNQIHVEITGQVDSKNKYVAMGFSENGKMGNASVIDCSSFDGSDFQMSFSYNLVNEHYHNLRPTGDVSTLFTNQRVQFVDGLLYCSADVRVEGAANDPSVFKYSPDTKYSVIMATGDTRTNGTQKGLAYHQKKRSVGPMQLLSDYSTPTPTPPSGQGTFDSSTCGTTKACYQPSSTDAVSYRVISDSSIEFEFSSRQSSPSGVYLALGFSSNGQMAPASVIECSSLGTDALSMKFSSNNGYSNGRIDGEQAIRAQYITDTQTSYQDGNIYCKGTVKTDGNANSQIFKYTPNQQYYLIVAKGTASAGGLGYHGNTNRYVSSQRLLTDLGAGNGSGSKVTLVILHAIFMCVAWMTMVPTAVIFARVLRSSWPTLKPGGLLIWFHIHRGANLIGIALMIAGFVLILIHKDWKFANSGWGGKHAIIGIIALCLAWLQPFISTLRCSPNDPRRPIFNYIHRGIGVIAMILATTAICIAGYHFTPSRNVAQLILALIPISVIFALSIFFVIFNNIIDVDTKSFVKTNGNSAPSQRTEDIPMRPTSKSSSSETTWTIRSPQDNNNSSSDRNDEVPMEKKRLWVNRFREFVVYGAVLIFVAIGTILSVFFALGLSS